MVLMVFRLIFYPERARQKDTNTQETKYVSFFCVLGTQVWPSKTMLANTSAAVH